MTIYKKTVQSMSVPTGTRPAETKIKEIIKPVSNKLSSPSITQSHRPEGLLNPYTSHRL